MEYHGNIRVYREHWAVGGSTCNGWHYDLFSDQAWNRSKFLLIVQAVLFDSVAYWLECC
jgi:hypothetical protein